MAANEVELISRCAAGDPAAFGPLYAAHAGQVKAYFLRSGFPASDADDLTQDTFARAFKSIRTFDLDRGTFSTWLAAVARNVARRNYPRRTQPEHFDPELAEEMLAAPDNPGRPAELREALDALAGCVGALAPELANLVRLRYVDGRTNRGIAAATGIPEATVRLRLAEAKGLLLGCLKRKGIDA